MKKIFKSFSVIAAAAVALSSCIKDDNSSMNETKSVQFYANSLETKTAFGVPEGNTYPTYWTANDSKIKLSLNLQNPKDVKVTPSDDYTTASFTAELEDDGSGTYTFYSLSPASAFNSFNDKSKYLSATIPTSQTPLENSVDESAQVLYAISKEYAEMPDVVSLTYKHFTAYGKLSFSNLALDGAQVKSIAVSSDVCLAGRWNYVIEDDAFEINSGSTTVTINTSEIKDVWFACAPVDLSNKILTITVNTDKGPLVKEITMSAGKKFEAGKIASFTVDMKGITFKKSKVYNLVNSLDDLTIGSEVIIVAAKSNVALSTTQNSNNRAQAAVTKDNNFISDPGSDVQVLTIADGMTSGTIAFYTGTGYLYAASSSRNYLRTETVLSANSSWKVTISNGIATIKAQGTNTRNWLRYNSGSSLFSCYSSGQADVAIYKLEGSGDNSGSTPSEPEVPVESYVFKKVNSVTSGKSYLMVADGNVAKPITSNYGYLNVETPTITNDEIVLTSLDNAFVISEVSGGYTIKQSDDRYLYQTGTYNSFNVAANPASGNLWSIELTEDKAFKITNCSVNKWIQYSSQYSSYGSYNNEQGTLPHLYELVED